MTQKDYSTITAIGVLSLALVTLLGSYGIALPLWVASLAPLVAGAALLATRGYVALKGADNTTVDEELEKLEDTIANLAKKVRNTKSVPPANAKPPKPPIKPTSVLMVFVAFGLFGCRAPDPCSPRAAAVMDAACAELVVQVVERQCPDAETVNDCPDGLIALVACNEAIDQHAKECSP